MNPVGENPLARRFVFELVKSLPSISELRGSGLSMTYKQTNKDTNMLGQSNIYMCIWTSYLGPLNALYEPIKPTPQNSVFVLKWREVDIDLINSTNPTDSFILS